MPKTEYDLFKDDSFPEDYIAVHEAILEVRKAVLARGVYLMTDMFARVGDRGGMTINIGGNNYPLLSKEDLDAQYDSYINKTHPDIPFTWVEDPSFVAPTAEELKKFVEEATPKSEVDLFDGEEDIKEIALDDLDLEEDFEDDDDCVEYAVEVPKIKMFEDVLVISKEDVEQYAKDIDCSALGAMIYLGSKMGLIRAIRIDDRHRIKMFVAIGNFGFILNS